ncbi:hypothetical protein F2P45_29755 [Massilia sp. CCM 8733]|uniref:Uncharacterized protein n=1 Tax=Massilia mucilaginosa TaxID=2609282 RepID=A0ABX0P304_9BURK|nr:hypothetical protein [Massilia mucilaginosa]NHZ93165.1 hypothetical protein [Massilia mucilaginosa]
MRKLMKLQWHDLRNQLLLLDDGAGPEAIFRTLVAGFRKYRTQFCSEPFSHLRFARYFSMQAADYPVAQSTMRDGEFRYFKKCIQRYEVREDLYSIMALLCETMERLVTVRIEQCCPRCHHDDFATCKALASGELVMQCAVCFHVQARHGAAFVGGALTFASAADLRLPGRPPAPSLPLPAQLSPRLRVDAGQMVDYNLVVLSYRDADTDSAGLLHNFYRGMPVAIFDDDTDEQGQPGHVIADGYVEPVSTPPPWAPGARWLCRIDKAGMRRVSTPAAGQDS